jgi:hypothetical protein
MVWVQAGTAATCQTTTTAGTTLPYLISIPTTAGTTSLFWVDVTPTFVQSNTWMNQQSQWAVWDDDPRMYQQHPAAPITPSPAELLERDQESFQRAVAEHDHQEADRLNRIITQRQQEIAAREAAADEQRRVAEEARVLRQARDQRAIDLLLAHLTPEQRETYSRNNWFIVEGGRSKTKYRINTRAIAGNIDVLESASLLHRERVTAKLCCHVPYHVDVPHHDHLLAQKIMLELAEDDFLRTANRTSFR